LFNCIGKVIGIITDRDLRLAADSPFLDETMQTRVKHLHQHQVTVHHLNTINNIIVIIPLQISEIMKVGVVTVEDTAPIVEAAKLMRVSEVGGLPVVNGCGKLVGVCSTTDLVDHLYVLFTVDISLVLFSLLFAELDYWNLFLHQRFKRHQQYIYKCGFMYTIA
jgi:CBS-domain-containing membrane protein